MRTNRRWLMLAIAGIALAGLPACSATSAHAAPPAAGKPGSTCGTARTAANSPVDIKVAKGTVNCAAVLRVENDYAAMVKAGQVPGNGGGAPVRVSGWTCQGYPTPQVLRTGDASECHTASAEVVAVLAVPASGS